MDTKQEHYEAQRLIALESYDIFDTENEKEFDDLAALASVVCNVPVALITFIGSEIQSFKSHHGTELTQNTRQMSFCTHTIATDEGLMIVPDARLDERFTNNPTVTGPTQIAFYAGVSLVNEDGYPLGTICVFDQKANNLSDTQVHALKTLGQQIIDKLELRRKVSLLEKTNHDLLNANTLIQKFASMAAHDIKNPLSNILMSSQALKMRHEKQEFEGCLRLVDLTISSTKNLINLVDEMLEYSQSPKSLLANKKKFVLNNLLNKIIGLLPLPSGVKINLPPNNQEIRTSIIALDQIILNLLSNAIRYNDKEIVEISIRFNQDDGFYKFEIQDNGIGIQAEYLDRIFGVNFTLGNTDRNNNKGTGIGLSTVKELVTALEGTVHVESEPGKGSIFFIAIKK